MTSLADAPLGPPPELVFRRRQRFFGSLARVWREREIVRSLAERQLRARYKQAVLGLLWALITPLALMVAFTVIFDRVGDIDTQGVPYALFAYMGLLPWTFFSGAATNASTSIVRNVALINKIPCPREVFPLAAVAAAFTDLVLSLVALVALFVVLGVMPQPELYWVPLIAVVQIVFTMGAALLIAVWVVYLRDLLHGVPLALQLGLLATPVAYGFEVYPNTVQWVMSVLNPLAPVIDAYRQTILLGNAPQLGFLGAGAVGSVIWFVLGYWMFKRMEAGIADVA